MAQPPLPDAILRETLAAIAEAGSITEAAKALGLSRTTLTSRWERAKQWAAAQGVQPPTVGLAKPVQPKAFTVDDLPSELPTAEELLARRRKEFARKAAAKDARHLVPVQVKIDGPIGLAIVGDPHVDDPGCDIELLERHIAVLNGNSALLPLAIGDFSNNWVGRLARLHAEQTTSAAESWVLVEWLVQSLHWLAMIAGNHDVWSGSGDPIQWMARAARTTYEAHGVRLGLRLPSGREIRLNARHDFRGKSAWNNAHGIGKAAQMGWRDHILTAGHTHVSGIQVVRDPMTGLISHCLRVGSYKTHDRFADELGLPNQTFTVCPVIVLRPQFSDDDNRLLTTFFDPETASEFLTWLRSRKSERAA
jgi:hypothetical protein